MPELDADLDTQMNAVGMRFVEWLNSPDNDRAPGTTCIAGVERFEAGMDWRELRDRHLEGLRLGDARRGDWLSLPA